MNRVLKILFSVVIFALPFVGMWNASVGFFFEGLEISYISSSIFVLIISIIATNDREEMENEKIE